MPSNNKMYTIDRVNRKDEPDRRAYQSTSADTVSLAHLTPNEVVGIVSGMMASGDYGDFVVAEVKN